MVLDQQEGRAAVLQHLSTSLRLMIDSQAWEKAFENSQFLVKVIEKHAEDNPDSATCLKRKLEDLDVKSIAEECGYPERKVYRMLKHDNLEVIRIGREMLATMRLGRTIPGMGSQP